MERGPAPPRDLLVYDVVMDYGLRVQKLDRYGRVQDAVVLAAYALGREQRDDGAYPLAPFEGILQGPEES
jgi:hypothetical protein